MDAAAVAPPTEVPPPAPVGVPPPAVVVAASWLVPGAGYWLIGHRARGVTVGVTILALYVGGLLLGGIRVVEVPFYDKLGRKNDNAWLAEVRAKPWSVAQVMTGPVGLLSFYLSVQAAQPDPSRPDTDRHFPDRSPDDPLNPKLAYGADSHARVNEIAVLYTAVAGMLNLLVMIDSGHRAEQAGGKRSLFMTSFTWVLLRIVRGSRRYS